MILRRMASAIRMQDWFTVFIEIFIVVVGIFLGLQVNDWAQERTDREHERAALERLFLEAENAQDLIAGYLQPQQRLNQMRRNAVQFVDGNRPVPENQLPLKIGLNTLARFPTVVPVSVVYDELRSAGQMQLIQSAELRDRIAKFHNDVARYNQLQMDFAISSDVYWNVYKRHVTWDYNPESTTSDILLSMFNWETLRADEDFIFAVIGLLRNQLVSEQGLLELREQAGAMCQALGKAIGRECKQLPGS